MCSSRKRVLCCHVFLPSFPMSTTEELKKEEVAESDSSVPMATTPQETEIEIKKTEMTTEEVAEVHEDGQNGHSAPSTAAADTMDTKDSDKVDEMISVKLSHGRAKQYELDVPLHQRVSEFKQTIFELTGVTPAMQKLFYNGIKFKDDSTLEDLKVKSNAKILLMGSTVAELVAANTKPKPEEMAQAEAASKTKEPLCQRKPHVTIIEKGVPEDAMVGILRSHEALPSVPLKGMKDGKGRSIRLTFKLELDQLWLGSAERTQKIPLGNISDIVAEAIVGHEQYHMVGFKIGTTEASRLWVYWVPSQYVEAIRRAIMN